MWGGVVRNLYFNIETSKTRENPGVFPNMCREFPNSCGCLIHVLGNYAGIPEHFKTWHMFGNSRTCSKILGTCSVIPEHVPEFPNMYQNSWMYVFFWYIIRCYFLLLLTADFLISRVIFFLRYFSVTFYGH
jgi:hypothetical protein